jgi:hypothetical protein
VSALLRHHVWQGGGDAIQHALEIDVDHPVPVLDLAAVQRRVRHQAGVVENRIDAAMHRDRPVNQQLDLLTLGDIGLHDSFRRKTKLGGQGVQTVEPAGAITSFAPSAARRRAVASPNPLLAPVMTTTLPVMFSDMLVAPAKDEDYPAAGLGVARSASSCGFGVACNIVSSTPSTMTDG